MRGEEVGPVSGRPVSREKREQAGGEGRRESWQGESWSCICLVNITVPIH